jgi:hypothetical protein
MVLPVYFLLTEMHTWDQQRLGLPPGTILVFSTTAIEK